MHTNASAMYRLSVRDNCTVITPLQRGVPRPPAKGTKRDTRSKGYISKRAASKVRQILWAWHSARMAHTQGRHGLNMLTLTLSTEQRHSDKYIKRHMLNAFLQIVRDKRPGFRYYWKAETQENGNIHFHIMLDVFLRKEWVRTTWNSIQAKHGYLPQDWAKNATAYPSTQVEAIKNAGDMGEYLASYPTKEEISEGRRLIEGRVWAISRELKNIERLTFNITEAEAIEILESCPEENLKTIEDAHVSIVCGAYHRYLLRNHALIQNMRKCWIRENIRILYPSRYQGIKAKSRNKAMT